MSLVINTNVTALNVARNLTTAFNRLSKSSERLSSGLRINSAADDAAGLAIRDSMRSNIRARNQGVRNANDGISLVQTAEGALNETSAMLIRMRELATQSANGTMSDNQRNGVQNEFSNLMDEIDRIANATEFNGTKLLDGSLSSSPMVIDFGGNNTADNHYAININAATSSGLGLGNGGPKTEAAYVAQHNLVLDTTDLLGNFFEYSEAPASVQSEFDPQQTSNGYWNQDNTTYYVFATDKAGSVHVLTGYFLTFQSDVNLTATGSASSISTQELAQQALDRIDQAIQTTNTIRANLGATQNSLNFSINYISTQVVNLQTAESRISDVDVTSEMSEFTRSQILTQAAVSLLAQANTLPQMALKLLAAM